MKRENAFLRAVFEWAEMFAVSVCVVLLLMSLVVRHSPVSGHSMYPTLVGAAENGQVDKLAAEPGKNDVLLISNLMYTPHSGDIVVTQSNYGMDKPLVKRVIATAGQTLRIDFDTWQVYVDGQLLDEPYVNRDGDFSMRSYSFETVMNDCDRDETGAYIIPEGYIFCMGDNRNYSADSRYGGVGLIDERFVVGRVLCRILPFDRFGAVH